MADVEIDGSNVASRAGQPSVVESFHITGLYGYRTISLSSAYAATILIARNGAGKTTLLGALDAFLKTQFSRLRDLRFNEVRCKLRGIDHELVLTHAALVEFLEIPTEGELIRLSRRWNILPSEMFNFILEEWPALRADYGTLSDHKVYQAIMREASYNSIEAKQICEKIRQELFERNTQVALVTKAIHSAMKEYSIV